MIFRTFRARAREGIFRPIRARGFDKKIESEDMGLPLTNASRLSEDNLPFNSDSEATLR